MTENEAIEQLEVFPEWNREDQWLDAGDMEELVNICIKALEEIQQYQAIGTVEECREATERQKAKEPLEDEYGHKCCPCCGWIAYKDEYGGRYLTCCENCGQAILWEGDKNETST